MICGVVCNIIVMCVEAKEWKHFSKQGIWGGIGHTRSGVSSLVLDEKQDQVILTTLLLCELQITLASMRCDGVFGGFEVHGAWLTVEDVHGGGYRKCESGLTIHVSYSWCLDVSLLLNLILCIHFELYSVRCMKKMCCCWTLALDIKWVVTNCCTYWHLWFSFKTYF